MLIEDEYFKDKKEEKKKKMLDNLENFGVPKGACFPVYYDGI